MNKIGTKRLETSRLILREFVESDFEMCRDNWQSDEKMTKFLTFKASDDLEVTKVFLQGVIDSYPNGDVYQWAIELKDTKEVIGTISSVGCDESIDKLILGYCIGSRWWGNGYMTEAGKEVVRYFFEEVNINRLESRADVLNKASQKVLEKIGLKYEGMLRQASRNNMGIVDTVIYGLVKEDYIK